MDESLSTEPEPQIKRRRTWQAIKGINPLNTPVSERFDPPLEHRPYEEIYAEVTAALAAIQKRRFGRKKAK